MTTNIDITIKELLEVIKTKKQELEAIEKESAKQWKSPCAVTVDNNTVNIKVATIPQLVRIITVVLIDRQFAQQAADILQIKDPLFFQAYSHEDWIDDCKKRMAIITRTDKKKQLAQLEERLNSIVSPEQRRQIELEAIQESIKNLT